QEAEEYVKTIRINFPRSEIQVVVYEEVFQKSLPTSLPDIITVTTRAGVQVAQLYPSSWNWNDEESIPF
ncbi:MAG: hypothetical protein Q8M94_04850, partial [Ignavibacteria bacterium]|nr:hypothetical protein [Ignavibacteria bacterium]